MLNYTCCLPVEQGRTHERLFVSPQAYLDCTARRPLRDCLRSNDRRRPWTSHSDIHACAHLHLPIEDASLAAQSLMQKTGRIAKKWRSPGKVAKKTPRKPKEANRTSLSDYQALVTKPSADQATLARRSYLVSRAAYFVLRSAWSL